MASLIAGSRYFQVIEEPAYQPEGAGEHLYVEIEKEGLNTEQVADALAKVCGRSSRDVGYAGRKDRHALTRQWFSVHFGKEEQLPKLGERMPNARVLQASRHRNKLRLGHLAGNSFRLGLSLSAEERSQLETTLAKLQREGIRNRFGNQRFGFNGATLKLAKAIAVRDWEQAVAWIIDPSGAWTFGSPIPDRFVPGDGGRAVGALKNGADAKSALRAAGPKLLKLAASAAQSAIFNAVLAGREQAGLLHTFRIGDVGHTTRGAPFTVSESDLADTNRRAQPGTLDAFTTGPLPGNSRLRPSTEREQEERAWSAETGIEWSWFDSGGELESPGERRSLLVPFRSAPKLESDGDIVWLTLGLPPGSYATEVLEQIGVTIPENRRGG